MNFKQLRELGKEYGQEGLPVNGNTIFTYLVEQGVLVKEISRYNGRIVNEYVIAKEYCTGVLYVKNRKLSEIQSDELQGVYFLMVERKYDLEGRRNTIYLTEIGRKFLRELIDNNCKHIRAEAKEYVQSEEKEDTQPEQLSFF